VEKRGSKVFFSEKGTNATFVTGLGKGDLNPRGRGKKFMEIFTVTKGKKDLHLPQEGKGRVPVCE